jgi:CRP-like cAMP-binding protein
MTELQLSIKSYFGIEESKLALLEELFEPEQMEKGASFAIVGKRCNKLSFIKTGYLRVFNHQDGKDVTQWVASQGEFITDLSSMIFGNVARWDIESLTDCELYTISKENYDKIATLIPEWHQLEKLFIAKCFMTLEDRIFSFLSMTAEQRYNMLFEMKSDLFNQVPLHYIASMLGMTPETLSRIRKKSIS